MCVDGLCKGAVPVTDDTVDLRLYQELCSLTGLQLEEERIKSQNSSACSDMFEPKMTEKTRAESWEQVQWVQHLDDVLLAWFVLGGPLHCPPAQIHSELRLRLIAAKLLEQKDGTQYERQHLTHT